MLRFGTTPDPNRRYTRRPGAYAILPHKGGLLATYQGGRNQEYQLPGGGIDPGESPLQALHREVFEETGYHITNICRLGVYQRYTFMSEYGIWAHKICHIFICMPTLQISDPVEPDHTVVWMNPKSATSMLSNAGDRHFLCQWMASR